jgi:NADPH:quinone reductase-like Zn-dependent oxidoreductase
MKTTSQSLMHAMVLEQYNAPLVYKQMPVPSLGKGQVLIRVMASGLNPLDLKIKAGSAAHAQVKIPAIPGIDMAGVVVEVENSVRKFSSNDEVYGMVGGVGNNQGTLAEYICVDADLLALKPSNISMKRAAAVPLVFITAWEGLVDRARVQAGQKVLVHGGAGGVGHMAIQIARAFGAHVFATTTIKGQHYVHSIGAEPINYENTTVEEYLNKYTNGKGFDIVFDTVGGSVLDDSFKSVKNYTGHVVSALGWGTHSLAPLSFKSATYSGIFTLLPLLSGNNRAHHGEIMARATDLITQNKLIPLLRNDIFTLPDANKAYDALATGPEPGKVVVTIN